MTTETTTAPPERCPVCGAAENNRTAGGVPLIMWIHYDCGITWHNDPKVDGHWYGECEYATATCLRTHTTLLPSEREAARNALVAAAIEETLAHQALGRLNTPDTPIEKQAQSAARLRWNDATAARIVAVAAHLALETRP